MGSLEFKDIKYTWRRNGIVIGTSNSLSPSSLDLGSYYIYSNSLSFSSDIYSQALAIEGQYQVTADFLDSASKVIATKTSRTARVKVTGGCAAGSYIFSNYDVWSNKGDPRVYTSAAVSTSHNRFINKSVSPNTKHFYPLQKFGFSADQTLSSIWNQVSMSYTYPSKIPLYSFEFVKGLDVDSSGKIQTRAQIACGNQIEGINNHACFTSSVGGRFFWERGCFGTWTGEISFYCRAGRWQFEKNTCQYIPPADY